jgi:hypothetical protein
LSYISVSLDSFGINAIQPVPRGIASEFLHLHPFFASIRSHGL